MNNFNKRALYRYTVRLLLFNLAMFFTSIISAQNLSFDKGKEYVLNEIKVSGIKSFSEQTVVAYTGLRKGQKIQIPGEEISAVIKNCGGWNCLAILMFI